MLDNPDDTVAWDDDSDSEVESSSTPHALTQQNHSSTTSIQPSSVSPPPPPVDANNADPSQSASTLKPTDNQPRRSQDLHSQADSDASYDLVSGSASRGPGSPREAQGKEKEEVEEDEPDWE